MLRTRPRARALPAFRRAGTVLTSILLASCASTTPAPTPKGPIGYVTDPAGNVVRNATGQCFRTGFWRPEYAIKECDPELVKTAAAPEKPAEVAQTPPPAQEQQQMAQEQPPETASAPPPEPVRRFVGADAFFEFDEAELTDETRRKLDRIADRARGNDEATVRVTGYADQIGGDDYNLSLSQRRADAVRTYLIERGLPENAVSVDARGETDPVVRCEGRQGASLIDCLQPNRRTEVEFSALEPAQ